MSTQGHFSLSLATGQQCLRDRYQGWVQLHRQGLRRAAFQSWRQAAAHQRHRMARPERLALQRWVGLAAGGRGSSPPQEEQGESPWGWEAGLPLQL